MHSPETTSILKSKAGRYVAWILIISAAALGVLFVSLKLRAPDANERSVPKAGSTTEEVLTLADLSNDSLLPRNKRPDLAGPEACAECHKQNYAGFLQTKHRLTCREVTLEKMPEGFIPPKSRLQSVSPDVSFEMSRENNRFFQTSHYKRSGVAESTKSSLDLVLGAGGEADDVFLSWNEDGHLWELPMAWLYPTGEWACSHFDPNSGGQFSRAMTARCVECHNTWVEHVVGTVNQFKREGAMLGVTCEVCHGPANEHAKFHRDNPNAEVAGRLVQATKLPRHRHIEICTQCHSNAMRPKGAAFSHHVGKPLEESFLTITTKHNEDDRVANQISYLEKSRCFQATEMTCTTCHNPHQPRSEMNAGSVACNKCHTDQNCKEGDRLPQELKSQCAACHMPSYLKINVNFQTADDNYVPPLRRTEHRIAVYPQARDELLLKHFRSQPDKSERVAELTASLSAHFTREAESMRSQHRPLAVIAALRELVRINPTDEHKRLLHEAVKFHEDLDAKFAESLRLLRDGFQVKGMAELEQILKLNPRDSKAHGRLGMEYAKAGNMLLAKQHLSAVADLDPNDTYGDTTLAWIAFLEGSFAESLRLYEKAEHFEPGEAKIKFQKGLALVRLGRAEEAIESFKKCLAIDPLNSNANEALIQGLIQLGRADQAIEFAERIARSTNLQNAQSIAVLAEVYRKAGRLRQAEKADRLLRKLRVSVTPVHLKQSPMELIRLTEDGKSFMKANSKQPFKIWGFNYDHDREGRLLEDYWNTEWNQIEADFKEMKDLGANCIRIHLQYAKFMKSLDQVDDTALQQLGRLLRLAEVNSLYVNITGLGCYHGKETPDWYTHATEQQRWHSQARFWQAIASTCKDSPALFCYDLMNEPVVGGAKTANEWLVGEFGGKNFTQRIALDLGDRDRDNVAYLWIKQLVEAIRAEDQRHLVTVGTIPWNTVWPQAKDPFHHGPGNKLLDFVAVHFYPQAGKIEHANNMLAIYDQLNRPVVVEEFFPLSCSIKELDEFYKLSHDYVDGYFGFYWGKTIDEYEAASNLQSKITAQFLRWFRDQSAMTLTR